MAMERKDNSGAIFKNDKQGVESRPDRTGSAVIAGVEYWVSGWLKDGAKGQFLSLAFKPKDAPKTSSKPQGRQSKPDSDDVPW